MPKYLERTTRLNNATAKKDILESFGTLKHFARAAAIDYAVVHRVFNGKPCTHEEKASVLCAYTELSPAVIENLVESVKANPTREGVEQLENLIFKLQTALENREEFWFLDGGAVPQCELQ